MHLPHVYFNYPPVYVCTCSCQVLVLLDTNLTHSKVPPVDELLLFQLVARMDFAVSVQPASEWRDAFIGATHQTTVYTMFEAAVIQAVGELAQVTTTTAAAAAAAAAAVVKVPNRIVDNAGLQGTGGVCQWNSTDSTWGDCTLSIDVGVTGDVFLASRLLRLVRLFHSISVSQYLSISVLNLSKPLKLSVFKTFPGVCTRDRSNLKCPSSSQVQQSSADNTHVDVVPGILTSRIHQIMLANHPPFIPPASESTDVEPSILLTKVIAARAMSISPVAAFVRVPSVNSVNGADGVPPSPPLSYIPMQRMTCSVYVGVMNGDYSQQMMLTIVKVRCIKGFKGFIQGS